MKIKIIFMVMLFSLPSTSFSEENSRFIHVIVALVDNKSQGIWPVPAVIGNGDDPRNNLYWGALYGVKTQFKKNKNWALLDTSYPEQAEILERIIFYNKKYNTYLVADAFKGSSIKEATKQFLISSSSYPSSPINHKKINIQTYGQADLVVYVGHNGLMDFDINEEEIPKSDLGKDSIILACKSKQYFSSWLQRSNSKAILLTTGNMAPEAYTLEAAIDGWMQKKSNAVIKELSAKAYSKYQRSGIKGARRLFFN